MIRQCAAAIGVFATATMVIVGCSNDQCTHDCSVTDQGGWYQPAPFGQPYPVIIPAIGVFGQPGYVAPRTVISTRMVTPAPSYRPPAPRPSSGGSGGFSGGSSAAKAPSSGGFSSGSGAAKAPSAPKAPSYSGGSRSSSGGKR